MLLFWYHTIIFLVKMTMSFERLPLNENFEEDNNQILILTMVGKKKLNASKSNTNFEISTQLKKLYSSINRTWCSSVLNIDWSRGNVREIHTCDQNLIV